MILSEHKLTIYIPWYITLWKKVVGDNEELQSSEKARKRLKKACNVKFDLVIDSENDIAIETSDPKLKKIIKACNMQTKANKWVVMKTKLVYISRRVKYL